MFGYFLNGELLQPESILTISQDFGGTIDEHYYARLLRRNEQLDLKPTKRNQICNCGSGLKYKKCHGRSKS
ncbi:SEC-C metal-binding domain-containing protein [Dyadobacter aurulentus]|uniref:SEC-C metal-binding domain-containing protein n=1 Tax=Dyadobacter sp. UC 10 TaxID=2605428 RepID=UPI001788B288